MVDSIQRNIGVALCADGLEIASRIYDSKNPYNVNSVELDIILPELYVDSIDRTRENVKFLKMKTAKGIQPLLDADPDLLSIKIRIGNKTHHTATHILDKS